MVGISKYCVALSLLLATSTTHANAEGGWSGFYVGLETGIASNVVDFTAPDPDDGGGDGGDEAFARISGGKFVMRGHAGPGADYHETASSAGVLAGAFIGYDQQYGDFVFGGLADIDYVGTNDLVFGGKGGPNYDLNWVATARVRAGFAPSEKLLIFGTGGVAIAGVSGSLSPLSEPRLIGSTQTGYVVGLGAEYRFKENWSIKGEFLHYDFGKVTSIEVPSSFEPRLDALKIGIAYRF